MQPSQQLPPLRPDDQRIDPAYLDTIAAPEQQRTVSPLVLWGMIGGGLLLVGIFLIVLFSSGSPSTTERMTNFLYRVQSLQALVDDSTDSLKDPDLRTANGSLSTILTGVESQVSQYLNGESDKKISKPSKDSPILAEYVQINQKLEEARLNVSFDSSYSREVVLQITKLRSGMSAIYNESSATQIREFLEKSDKDLKALSGDIEKFND